MSTEVALSTAETTNPILTMYLTCDIYLTTAEGRHFEWVIFISASSYSEATRMIEQRVRERWTQTPAITELNLQAITNKEWAEQQVSITGKGSEIYVENEPLEIVRRGSALQRIWSRFFGGQG